MASKKARPIDKPLSKAQLREAIIEHAKLTPTILDEKEFAKHVDKIVLPRYQRGEKLLDEVRQVVKRITARQANEGSREDLDLAIQRIDQAVATFQFCAKWDNCATHGDDKAGEHVILWSGSSRMSKARTSKRRK
jgi:hypothetical protein